MKLKKIFSRSSEKDRGGREILQDSPGTSASFEGRDSQSTGSALAATSSLTTSATSDNGDSIRVTITELDPDTGRVTTKQQATLSKTRKATFSVSRTSPFAELWDKIRDAGFEEPRQLRDSNGKRRDKYAKGIEVETYDEIEVVSGETQNENSIGIDESFLHFANRRYGQKIKLDVSEEAGEDGRPVDCVKDARGLKITFLRTVRMPDDGKYHPLPAALGTFPLYNVSAYADSLPPKIVNDGGIFLPMFQREALWIGLECKTNAKYALRVSVGRINAISGLSMDEDQSDESVQDYVVVPGQDWLDGICVGAGIVRQFVAMPLGSGYTVEGQKTGEEKHGGLQIEIIPSMEYNLRAWMCSKVAPDDPQSFGDGSCSNSWLQDDETARTLSLKVGEKIRSYPQPAFHEVPCLMSHVVGSSEKDVTFAAGQIYKEKTRSYHTTRKAKKAPNSGIPLRLQDSEDDTYTSSAPTFPGYEDVSQYNSSRYTSSAEPFPGYQESSNQLHPTRLSDVSQEDEGVYRSAASDDEDMLDSEAEPGAEACLDASVSPNNKPAIKDIRSMGLAAGGLLMQDIYSDYHHPTTWNPAASKLIHVHILDPASCESVTHVVTPPPPIDAETYAKTELPFYVVEERPDQRLEGGDFENVQSVSAMDKHKVGMEEKPLDPTILAECQCGVRLCDCVIRPCNHQFCHICVKKIDTDSSVESMPGELRRTARKCPTCGTGVSHVAGFSAPMNLPGEESIKMRVPVNVLEVRDGRTAFKSVMKSRI